ncbi:hypothetical protein CHKEEEPN_1659 [Methylorubrum podarium]|nr:hypothetical protein CHKEEEPN_1659 [Methylorubrum podarium]
MRHRVGDRLRAGAERLAHLVGPAAPVGQVRHREVRPVAGLHADHLHAAAGGLIAGRLSLLPIPRGQAGAGIRHGGDELPTAGGHHLAVAPAIGGVERADPRFDGAALRGTRVEEQELAALAVEAAIVGLEARDLALERRRRGGAGVEIGEFRPVALAGPHVGRSDGRRRPSEGERGEHDAECAAKLRSDHRHGADAGDLGQGSRGFTAGCRAARSGTSDPRHVLKPLALSGQRHHVSAAEL